MLGGPAEDGALIVRPFARDTMVAIVSPEHPWARRTFVTLQALSREPLILREPGSAGRDRLARALRKAGIEPRGAMERSSTEALQQAGRATGGAGPLARALGGRGLT